MNNMKIHQRETQTAPCQSGSSKSEATGGLAYTVDTLNPGICYALVGRNGSIQVWCIVCTSKSKVLRTAYNIYCLFLQFSIIYFVGYLKSHKSKLGMGRLLVQTPR